MSFHLTVDESRIYRGQLPSWNGPYPYTPIPDRCGRRKMNWPEFLTHISKCEDENCKEVLQNHIELCRSLGVEFHPPR